jgi:hypothetical protein
MADEIESAEALAERVNVTFHLCWGPDHEDIFAGMIKARDAAIRAELIGELRRMAAEKERQSRLASSGDLEHAYAEDAGTLIWAADRLEAMARGE